MMFNEQDRNSCWSPDFRVDSSSPSLAMRTLTIIYSDLKVEKRLGNEEIILMCRGFRNPISKKVNKGFHITLYDSEFQDENNPSPNQI